MIEWTTGDLFEVPADARVITVNCVGIMGKGVALGAKVRYPQMFTAYKRDCRLGRYTPGCVLEYKISESLTIYNAATKNTWRHPSQYAWVEACLVNLANLVEQGEARIIAIPPLGCGNGGLIWSKVRPMYEKHLGGSKATYVVLEPEQKRVLTD